MPDKVRTYDRAKPLPETISKQDSYAVCRCGRRIINTQTWGWVHCHIRLREFPAYCQSRVS